MNEQIEKKNNLLYCENCGVRIQNKDPNNNILDNNILFCQYCGTEIKFDYESYPSDTSFEQAYEKEKKNIILHWREFYLTLNFQKILSKI